ncbi:MAG: hypothetical protein ACREML_08360, partial [Vulcanimicrobiaceae bacterium]
MLTSIWLDYPWRMIVDGINDVLVAGAAIGLLMFALGFPRDLPVRWRIPADVLGGLAWLGSAALLLAADVGATYFARPAVPQAHVYNGIQSAIYIAAMLIFILKFARSRGADQIRVGVVVGAFLVAIVGYLVAEHLYPGPLKYWQYVALEALPVAPALVVFYGATRYHMLGIDFLVNRALVYAAMMAAVAGIVGLAEEGFSYWFVMNTNLAYAIIIAITLVFGTCFGKIRDAVRFVVDRVLFRDRLFAHDSLDVLAREIPHALDRDRIEYALTSAVQQALKLRCAVLFEQRGDHFTVVADTHWPPSATLIPQDDPVIQRVIQQGIAQFLAERDYLPWSPELKAVAPRVAVPIEVEGGSPFVAIYGLELSGVDIDPDEMRALERLAASAAVGFSNLRTRELAEHLAELMNLRT